MSPAGGGQRRFVRATAVDVPQQLRPLNVAVVGYGYWGPNLVRNVVSSPTMELAALCERDAARSHAFRAKLPGIRVEADFDKVAKARGDLIDEQRRRRIAAVK